MKNFQHKKIAVLGLGIEGLSSAQFLAQEGAGVTILDRKTEEELDQEILKKIKSFSNYSSSEARSLQDNSSQRLPADRTINFKLGMGYLENLNNFDIIVRSPGIRLNTEELRDAEKRGTVITSQTKLFFDLCPCPIIGVTGTKGKGTTSSLIFEMLKKQGADAYLGGNIGTPPLDFLKNLNERSLVVLELSSFQLQDLAKSPPDATSCAKASNVKKALAGKPHIAVVLMITSEHLDYHKDVNEYVEAKRNILRFQTPDDFAVINRDYPASNESDIFTEGKVFFVSRERGVDEGCFVRNGKIILRTSGYQFPVVGSRNQVNQVSVNRFQGKLIDRKLKNQNLKTENRKPITEIEIIETRNILLPGDHNLENVCAAVMAASLEGVSKENITGVLKTFKGLEHRLELVGEINGVRYYDDSFSTTPETAIAAIQAFKNPEILILGGSSKGSDFTELGNIISKSGNIKAIIGIGVEWERIKSQFKVSREARSSGQSSKFKVIEGLKDMCSIVQKVSEIAKSGDVVLLSPACASFGMFRNYKDRGEQFKREVKALKV